MSRRGPSGASSRSTATSRKRPSWRACNCASSSPTRAIPPRWPAPGGARRTRSSPSAPGLTPTPELELRAEYTRIKKDGERPFSMAFASPGGNFMEILEPIDHTVHDFRLTASFVRENWQLKAGYTFSAFENGFSGVTADNPCFGLVAALTAGGCGNDAIGAQPRGLVSLPPGNQAHTFSLAGGVNLPHRTRLSGNFAYSLRLQDEPFQQHTINGAIAGDPLLVLPQRSLDGVVGTALVNANVATRPIAPLTLTLKYRMFNLDDMSDEPVFSAHVLNDRTLVVDERTSPRFGYTKHNADLDAWAAGNGTGAFFKAVGPARGSGVRSGWPQ